MRHTETYFGLEQTSKGITADGGKSVLPLLSAMTPGVFEDLVFDIECWLEKEPTPQEIKELRELLDKIAE